MKYPLVYTYIDEVRTDAWAVLVILRGRSLMAFEDEEWWAEGVDPGGFAANGPVPQVAAAHLRAKMFGVLSDMAAAAKSAEAFCAEARIMFSQVNKIADAEWAQARKQVQAQSALEEPFESLDKVFGDVPTGIELQVTSQTAARMPTTASAAPARVTRTPNQFEELKRAA